MADMSTYFKMNDGNSLLWMQPNTDQELVDFPEDSFNINTNSNDNLQTVGRDAIYAKKIEEFDITIQEKIEEFKEDEIEFVQKWTYVGLQVVTLITEHLVSHPFIVLRRQCQVNNKLLRYHIFPVTLVPVIVNIHRWQGLTCLWKGVGSILIIKGLTLAVQDLLSKITQWPKEVTADSSKKQAGKHIMLKFITCAVVTPFYSASLVETVQSEIASERPEFLDVFKEGFRRLLSFGVPQKGRMLPVWSLIVPTALYFIAKHFFAMFMKTVISRALVLNQDSQHRKQGAIPKDFETKDKNIELTTSLVAVLSADIVLYPLETILHRLHLQGTRTIIDNLDDGLSVTPILTNFEGVVDCYENTIQQEGTSGLYKGFGTVVLQCLTYTSIIKLSKFVLTQVSLLFCKNDNSCYQTEIPTQNPAPVSHQTTVKNRREFKIKKNVADRYDFSSDSDTYESYQPYAKNFKN